MGLSVDLHSHTNMSDGLLGPRALVKAAIEQGVDILAVTDHDTTEGVPVAMEEADGGPLLVLPGMEISAHHGKTGLHILAYFAPSCLKRLGSWQAMRRRSRQERLAEILDRLDGLGLEIDRELVGVEADSRGSPGRPHVARALVAAGHVADTSEAFERFLGKGCPAYVQDRGPPAKEAIELVHDLPGLAVVAHPVFDDVDEVLEELAGLGLDGVEAYHFCHEPEVARHFHKRADDLGLLISGGSDFHGFQEEADLGIGRLGTVALPSDEWERFADALRSRAGLEGIL